MPEPSALRPTQILSFDGLQQVASLFDVENTKGLIIFTQLRQHSLFQGKVTRETDFGGSHFVETAYAAPALPRRLIQARHQILIRLAPFHNVITVTLRGARDWKREIMTGYVGNCSVFHDKRMPITKLRSEQFNFGPGLARHQHPGDAAAFEMLNPGTSRLPGIRLMIEQCAVKVCENDLHSVRKLSKCAGFEDHPNLLFWSKNNGRLQVRMSKSWPILTVGFASLIALIVVFGYGAMHRARILHRETIATHQSHLQTEAHVHAVSAQMYLAGLLVRDYLLDSSQTAAQMYRQQLREIRASVDQRLDALRGRMGPDDQDALRQLRLEVMAYWESLDPMFEWTPQQKAAQGAAFLRQKVLPRRQAVAALAERLAKLNTTNLQKEQQVLDASQADFQRFLGKVLGLCLLLGVVIAFASIHRFWSLERQAEIQNKEIKETGWKLRRLSRGLVNAQETERKSISRELHDAVGPLVTGVRLELANLESSRLSLEKFVEHLNEARQLNAQTLELVQNMAMALRPSMLDDLGLAPALEWQGRELSRRSGVPVVVQIDGSLDHLPEAHRTCIYRVVQEALTNCARHAHAKNIRVSLYGGEDFVGAAIQDDGVGFDTQDLERRGLGLLGMQERARELDGKVSVVSNPGRGTVLTVELPIRSEVSA